MPESRVAARPYALLIACGLALAAASPVVGQSDPLSEPFPAVLELSDLDGVIGFGIVGVDESDQIGWSVNSGGDINGDGVDDIVIGAFSSSPVGRGNAGSAFVVFGRGGGLGFEAVVDLANLDGTNGFRIDGANRGDQAGLSVASAGDVNGDGVGDFLIGAPGADPDGRMGGGSTYLVFGRSNRRFPATIDLGRFDAADGVRLDGSKSDGSGFSVASAGDLNADGVDDVIIGASLASPAGRKNAGVCYVVFGRKAGTPFPATLAMADLDGTDGFQLNGVDIEDFCGQSVACAGDVNGDGVDDVIVGANGADSVGQANAGWLGGAGSSYLVFGRPAGEAFPGVLELSALDGINGFRLDGVAPLDNSGVSVAAAGDMNGDGMSDLIIGAPNASPGLPFMAGASYVVFGRKSFPNVLNLADLDGSSGFRLDGVETEDSSGASVASVGDINGDGSDDVAIAARGAARSYVLFGRDVAKLRAFPSSIDLSDVPGLFGIRLDGSVHVVASAGDVNGDGVDDLVVGHYSGDPLGRNSAGMVYVVFGRLSNR